jgi:hypothetical protein
MPFIFRAPDLGNAPHSALPELMQIREDYVEGRLPVTVTMAKESGFHLVY